NQRALDQATDEYALSRKEGFAHQTKRRWTQEQGTLRALWERRDGDLGNWKAGVRYISLFREQQRRNEIIQRDVVALGVAALYIDQKAMKG
ncbi:MAG: hypothetical protein L6R35_007477, partial [Caloplaca aegaea]